MDTPLIIRKKDPHMDSSSRQTVTTPTTFVIFGASGNLAKNKLFPALYELLAYNHLPDQCRIVAVFRQTSAALDTVMSQVEVAMLRQGRNCDPDVMQRLKDMIVPVTMDSTNQEDYYHLRDVLAQIDTESGHAHQHIFYLAIPPDIFSPVIDCLGNAGLNDDSSGKARRIFVEKPFGSDLASARELITTMKRYFREEQIYRIDHYLAKETVQNIFTFRFQNPLIRSVWSREGIDSITIRATETIDIEGRSNFYENMGAMRDLVQSHLLQLAALTLMNAPESNDSDAVHQRKVALLSSVRVRVDNDLHTVVRGQYDGYKSEVNNEQSTTETYVKMTLAVDLPEWQGVPIVLETGKALSEKDTSITVVFNDRHSVGGRNILTIQIQPKEAIGLSLLVKKPGFTTETQPVEMEFSYNSLFGGKNPDAYERVLFDAIAGDQTLFSTSEEVLLSWEILQPIIDSWNASRVAPIVYARGSSGPIV